MQNILILGGSGFIGSNLVKELSDHKVDYKQFSSKEINLLNSTSSKLGPHINSTSCLVILSAVTRQNGNNLETCELNIKMALNLANLLSTFPVGRCIYISSCDVYGIPEKLLIDERTSINPQTFYAVSKYTSEKILENKTKRLGIKFTVLRFNGIFGPGQKNTQYGINQFIKSILEHGEITLWGKGEELRDFVYVKDLVKLITKFAIGNYKEGVYNLVSGKSITFKEVAMKVGRETQKKYKLVYKKRTGPNFDQKFNNRKIKEIFPSFKFTNTLIAIKETYESLK